MSLHELRSRYSIRFTGALALATAMSATAGCDQPWAGGRVNVPNEIRMGQIVDGDSVRTNLPGGPLGAAPLGDPRTDGGALTRAVDILLSKPWSEGYAQLVETAGNESRIGWSGTVERPVPVSSDHGIVRASDPGVESLIADLLGATLVDAQDELWTAWSALEQAGSPGPARTWLTEPPPWPPASIEKYLKREGENAMSLIETLAGELSPLPAARAWLIRSWLAPPRIVDAPLLAEMAHAADGALGREPRFRSWLRAEWTASARQRYRRVTRLAASGPPAPPTR